MRVFLTGATGFIGSHLVPRLQASGHEVTGLARSDENAGQLAALGVAVQRGDLAQPDSLARGAAAADATIHCAFIHDFSRFAENIAIDRAAVAAMLGALPGAGKTFILTSGVLQVGRGQEATELDRAEDRGAAAGRGATEGLVADAAARGVRAMVVRLPQVHDREKAGFITYMVQIAQAKGVSAYVGDGSGRWAAAHVSDAVEVYRLALERGEAGARYHAIGEGAVPMRRIAEAIGRRLGVPVISIPPEDAAAHFGFLGAFAGGDVPASSRLTQDGLGWRPTGPGLIEDLEATA